jgi:hypothetical protein
MSDPLGDGLSRRALLRSSLLVGLGAAAAVAALPELAGTALASNADIVYAIVLDNGTTGGEYLCQADWWYCVKCYGMYHSDNDTAGGVCPDGGTHQNNTDYTQYVIPHSGGSLSQTSPAKGVQVGWRWCSKCQGLFWGSAAAESVCPAGGQHLVSSGAYVYDLAYGGPSFLLIVGAIQDQETAQSGWLYCSKCRGLFYGHGSATGGVCPAGGAHSQASGSSNYDMPPYKSSTIE